MSDPAQNIVAQSAKVPPASGSNVVPAPTSPSQTPKKPNLFLMFGIILLIFLISVALFYFKSQKSRQGTNTIANTKASPDITLANSVNNQKPIGDIFGFSGTIAKIETEGERGPKDNPEYGSAKIFVNVQKPEEKTIEVNLSGSQMVYDLEDEATAEARKRHLWYRVLKTGQSVYISTHVAVNKINVILPEQIAEFSVLLGESK